MVARGGSEGLGYKKRNRGGSRRVSTTAPPAHTIFHRVPPETHSPSPLRTSCGASVESPSVLIDSCFTARQPSSSSLQLPSTHQSAELLTRGRKRTKAVSPPVRPFRLGFSLWPWMLARSARLGVTQRPSSSAIRPLRTAVFDAMTLALLPLWVLSSIKRLDRAPGIPPSRRRRLVTRRPHTRTRVAPQTGPQHICVAGSSIAAGATRRKHQIL